MTRPVTLGDTLEASPAYTAPLRAGLRRPWVCARPFISRCPTVVVRAHHRIGLILLALVLVPTLGYVAYETNALSENEALLEAIYAQQLDALLFSINQRAFDVSEAWARDLTADLQRATLDGRPPASALDSTLARDDALVGAFLADTTLRQTVVTANDSADAVMPLDAPFVQRLLGRYRVGYQQLEIGRAHV